LRVAGYGEAGTRGGGSVGPLCPTRMVARSGATLLTKKTVFTNSTMADTTLKSIIDYLKTNRGVDFSGHRPSMVGRHVRQRLAALKCKNYNEYFRLIQENDSELDSLIDVLTINVSRFFRNALTFEYFTDKVLPVIVHRKADAGDRSLRIWSTACSTGEEPYSVAIIVNEFLKKENIDLTLNIFATDIDDRAIESAKRGIYPLESVENIKYRLLRRYFIADGEFFKLGSRIKDLVMFTHYDILDERRYVPSESVFGNFDIVLCRNLLIYFNIASQERIFGKLHHALADDGCLILGEAEAPTGKYQKRFRKINDCCHIYGKS